MVTLTFSLVPEMDEVGTAIHRPLVVMARPRDPSAYYSSDSDANASSLGEIECHSAKRSCTLGIFG